MGNVVGANNAGAAAALGTSETVIMDEAGNIICGATIVNTENGEQAILADDPRFQETLAEGQIQVVVQEQRITDPPVVLAEENPVENANEVGEVTNAVANDVTTNEISAVVTSEATDEVTQNLEVKEEMGEVKEELEKTVSLNLDLEQLKNQNAPEVKETETAATEQISNNGETIVSISGDTTSDTSGTVNPNLEFKPNVQQIIKSGVEPMREYKDEMEPEEQTVGDIVIPDFFSCPKCPDLKKNKDRDYLKMHAYQHYKVIWEVEVRGTNRTLKN